MIDKKDIVISARITEEQSDFLNNYLKKSTVYKSKNELFLFLINDFIKNETKKNEKIKPDTISETKVYEPLKEKKSINFYKILIIITITIIIIFSICLIYYQKIQ